MISLPTWFNPLRLHAKHSPFWKSNDVPVDQLKWHIIVNVTLSNLNHLLYKISFIKMLSSDEKEILSSCAIFLYFLLVVKLQTRLADQQTSNSETILISLASHAPSHPHHPSTVSTQTQAIINIHFLSSLITQNINPYTAGPHHSSFHPPKGWPNQQNLCVQKRY